ncbi:conserved Plasmodium protein, unknown function [Plasmodium gallinaceum]|uniref:DNA endonuclease activator Ctp1 C-terminal domain-containing protein n=1 Tax=Plasmodium gallinaceum TaxID=5849 RepID=A0A1J1GYE2_PLAGA|nr:conserved Plasmodium protein, unknown function [Plasmodium gallinaceum]CRG97327.1 conserved Plasmodium protein, unknown function [Plasmodium gallinaceum]
MNITKNEEISLNKGKIINMEMILGDIFDELIYDFKKKFIEKIFPLIDKIKNDAFIMKVNENRNKINIIQEHEKNKKECKLYNESILDVYLKSFTDDNKKKLLEKLQKEKNEEDINKIYRKINYENDLNGRVEFLNSLESESSNVSTQEKEIKKKGSFKTKNELNSKLDKEINNKSEESMENINYSSSTSDYKHKHKNINLNESIIQPINSNKLNNIENLNTFSQNNKKNKKNYSNIKNEYNVKNMNSERFFDENENYFHYHNDRINLNYHKTSPDKIIKNNEVKMENNYKDEQIEKLKTIFNSKSFLGNRNNKINLNEKYEELDKICEEKAEDSNSKLSSNKLENYNMKNYLDDELKEKKDLNNCNEHELFCSKNGMQNKKINESKKCEHLFFEVIRGKRRKNLKGFECEDCKLFYNELYLENPKSEILKKDRRKDEFLLNGEKKMKIEVHNDTLKEISIKNSNKKRELEEEIYNHSMNNNEKKINKNNDTLNKKYNNNIPHKNDETYYNYTSNDSFDSYKYNDNYSNGRNKNYNLIKERIKKESNRKEKEKKKMVQSFSRHRYHSKVNDSPQNFWEFDFFK